MPLINLDELVLLGPGSEWFWTMAQFVVVAITLIGIFFQLRVARGANAFAHLDSFESDWASERILRSRHAVLVAMRDGNAGDVLMADGGTICNFWEKIGALARAGHLDVRLLRNGSGTHCQTWWGVLGPWVRTLRDEDPDPTIFENFEWLSAEMDREDHRRGVPPIVNAEWLAITEARRIETSKRLLESQKALRTVIVESPAVSPRPHSPRRSAGPGPT